MARKSTKIVTFSDQMAAYAKEVLPEAQQVRIAKNKYLMSIEADIQQAKAEGYPYPHIAVVANQDFLDTGVQKTFVSKNKEGEEVEHETKISPADIKKICEPEENK